MSVFSFSKQCAKLAFSSVEIENVYGVNNLELPLKGKEEY